jgi:coenzyme Q-binding protein COQ10
MPTHADRVHVPYNPAQMFDLVADVGKYPVFLPWCTGALVRTSTETQLVADLTIGFGPFHESFTSRVKLDRPPPGGPGRIRTSYENGPFKYLNNQWVFTPRAGLTQIDFWVDFEFHNRILQKAIGAVFNEAVKRMVSAFLKRARDVYGAPTADQIHTEAAAPAALQL